eukprot:30437-Prymnesium_polylepis.1
MLVDFRRHVIRHVLRSVQNSTAREDNLPAFWAAISKLFDSGWDPLEYTNLLNFAHHSRKWHGRYEWQIVGHEIPLNGYTNNVSYAPSDWPILSHALHLRALGCNAEPFESIRNREPTSFAIWSKVHMLYPSGTAQGVHFDGERGLANLQWRRSMLRSKAWHDYVLERQKALEERAQRRNDLSAVDVCGKGIVELWTGCFDANRTRGEAMRFGSLFDRPMNL